MFELNVKGTLTSKRAAHVPVIRRWKLVWERREFGTQVDKLDKTIRLPFGAWADIPDNGANVKVTSDLRVVVKRLPAGSQGDHPVEAFATWQGQIIPGTRRTFNLPEVEAVKVIAWHTDLWKGVKLDLESTISYDP